MGFFLIGSILCAVSRSMIMLIVFSRSHYPINFSFHDSIWCHWPVGAISGIGGGGILTSVMIVVSDVVSLEKRGTYQGVLGVVVALSNSLGPLIGGLFTEKVSWRWCFVSSSISGSACISPRWWEWKYINIPLTSISILVVAFVLPLKRVKGDVKGKLKKIDYLGCATMLISAILILLPISWFVGFSCPKHERYWYHSNRGGTKYSWSSAGVIAPLVLGIVFFGLFVLIELKLAALPLIPSIYSSLGGHSISHSSDSLWQCTFSKIQPSPVPWVEHSSQALCSTAICTMWDPLPIPISKFTTLMTYSYLSSTKSSTTPPPSDLAFSSSLSWLPNASSLLYPAL